MQQVLLEGPTCLSQRPPLTPCFCLGDRASLSSPGLPATHDAVQAALQLLIILLPQALAPQPPSYLQSFQNCLKRDVES